jgi:transposase
MFLRVHGRDKDGKFHQYYSLVETIRTARGPRQRTLAYLGELNVSEEGRWRKAITVFNGDGTATQLSLFPSDVCSVPEGDDVALVNLKGVRWERPRDFGDIYTAVQLWGLLGLDDFFRQSLSFVPAEVPWDQTVLISTVARLLAPGSELHIEQFFYPQSAMDDLTGIPPDKINTDRLYRLLDHLLPLKEDLEKHLKGKLGEIFVEPFDLVLYDLTSTYFEGAYEGNEVLLRGYSRDHRPDCKQLVIGLVVTKRGLPFGYNVFRGNQGDAPSLKMILKEMESAYGKADRIWVVDRGVASEENLSLLRQHGASYLVGTPRSMLRKYEQALIDQRDWQKVKEGITAKVVSPPEGSDEIFLLCKSEDRARKEESIHQRFQKKMEEGLEKLKKEKHERRLFERMGRLKTQCSRVARCYQIEVTSSKNGLQLSWTKDEAALRYAQASEGAYLLRGNVPGPPDGLWNMYMQLGDAEAAFRNLKTDLNVRPIYHQKQNRIEGHILIAFLAYVLWKTLDILAKEKQIGLTARMILKTLHGIKSGDIILPLVDGRTLRLRRISQPDKDQKEILQRLGIKLPDRLAQDVYQVTENKAKCSADSETSPMKNQPLSTSISSFMRKMG